MTDSAAGCIFYRELRRFLMKGRKKGAGYEIKGL